EQSEEVAGRADAADQQVGRAPRDQRRHEREQDEVDGRPVGALAEPHGVDAEQAPRAEALDPCRSLRFAGHHGGTHLDQVSSQTLSCAQATETGMANPSASTPSPTYLPLAIPITCPCESTTGPPLLPGLIGAENWTESLPSMLRKPDTKPMEIDP